MAKNQDSVSAFANRIYALLKRIPYGRVVTYKELARAAGVRSPQAVGQALRVNPQAPVVPCHRVIRSDCSIGGYAGATEGKELQRKLSLLAIEGVTFRDGILEDCEKVWHFD